MHYFILIISILHGVSSLERVSTNLRKKLDAEEQNAICCMHHMDCCREAQKPTSFEVKSMMTECPNQNCLNWSNAHQVIVQRNKTTPEKLTDCKQKLLLTIKVTNEGIPSDKSEYVIIDHITDPTTLQKVRILNPYAIRIRQQPMLQAYQLKFERAVNGEAKEQVFNKHTRNYRGCDTSYESPTCGLVQHEGKMVPYSTGFCCSCDAEKNRQLEEHGSHVPLVQWPLRDGVPDYRKNRPEENDYEHYKHYGFIRPDGKMVYGRPQKRADKSVNYQQFTELKDGKIRQRRGGQTCDDADLNIPESFRESTHCLTFSNMWYSVYQISKPEIIHKLRIQIFQKYEDCHGNTHWMDITQGKTIELGTQTPLYVEKDIIAKYCSEDIDFQDQALDYKNLKLLIPERRVVDPEQFMLLPKNSVSDGRTCDTAGVGYEAFFKQRKRCAQPQGSCLGNQPNQLHESDAEAVKQGRVGQYFLKFYGTLAEDPVGYNSSGHIQYLKMVYTKRHVSTLSFELNADLVTLLKPNSFATITEAYTDATDPSKAKIIVKVTNSGLLYGVFYVRMSGCPLEVAATFNNIASKSVLIPPQHQHIFNLLVEYPLPMKEFYCSIHVHNINQELIAVRQVRIMTYDRCICIWHCECACYVADKGLKCLPMTLDNYHAAGFQGGFPTETHFVETSYLDEMLAMMFNMFFFLVLTLLAMGLVKALLGLCSQEISLWGLDTILGTESSVKKCGDKKCEYKNNSGISLAGQFCLNVMFFFLYPLALFNLCIRHYCFSAYTIEDDECSCEERWVNYECDDEVCRAKSTKSSINTDQKSNGEKSSEGQPSRSNEDTAKEISSEDKDLPPSGSKEEKSNEDEGKDVSSDDKPEARPSKGKKQIPEDSTSEEANAKPRKGKKPLSGEDTASDENTRPRKGKKQKDIDEVEDEGKPDRRPRRNKGKSSGESADESSGEEKTGARRPKKGRGRR
ncbi:hypothetical protein TcasGA2_TC009345 [Tribolium castaneum]|uniref:Generative cell specific-1/HAP2 domain-containing protein n=1 Tax=Tribolium castaneum TaxID=7070 RepID=D6WRF1_TRICA|nr:PREDICTED: uncharacterized protein LOC103313508 isoform X1 [Tribolium castaneum]EFA06462.1 hypothetical protein TcasGA2_TC009345 [Tribolium castaneum]|eukprot:XP_008195172.2 PREDICTED: uncharacterized protein LOC103313508 isoform X1 [Tribolium castaneum]